MDKKSLEIYKVLLVILITSISITDISMLEIRFGIVLCLV